MMLPTSVHVYGELALSALRFNATVKMVLQMEWQATSMHPTVYRTFTLLTHIKHTTQTYETIIKD